MLIRKLRILDIYNPSVFFIIFYVFFLLLGAILNISNIITFPNLQVSEKTFNIIVLYLVVFIVSAFFLANFLLIRGYPKRINTDLIYDLDINKVKFVSTVFYCLGIAAYLFFYFKVGKIPLLAYDVENARATLKQGLGRYIILGNNFLYCSLFFETAFLNSLNLKRKVYYLIKIVIACVIIAGVGYRSPVAYLVFRNPPVEIFIY